MDSCVLTCVKSKLATTRLRTWSLIQMIKLCQMTLKGYKITLILVLNVGLV